MAPMTQSYHLIFSHCNYYLCWCEGGGYYFGGSRMKSEKKCQWKTKVSKSEIGSVF